jgi:hypothetical protein
MIASPECDIGRLRRTANAVLEKCLLFHCGNWATWFLPDIAISAAPLVGPTLEVENHGVAA